MYHTSYEMLHEVSSKLTRHYFAGAAVMACSKFKNQNYSNFCFAKDFAVREEPNFVCILGRKMRFLLINSRLFLFLGVLLLSLLLSFANKVDDEESCRVYAGGQVYPQERRTSEHALHWSKAQSNLKRVLLILCISFKE